MTRVTGPDCAVMCNSHTLERINASDIEWLGWQGRMRGHVQFEKYTQHTHTHTHRHTDIDTHTHTHKQTHIHTDIHTDIHTGYVAASTRL